MKRRTFVSLGGALIVSGCAGLVESGGDGSPIAERFDCDDAERPEPDVESDVEFDIETEDGTESFTTVGSTEYPSPPNSFENGEIRSFLGAHEIAFRRNELVDRYGRGLVYFDTSVDDVDILDRHEGHKLTRIDYYEELETVTEEGEYEIGEGLAAAAYAIDETGLVRAETRHRNVRDSGTSLRDATPDPIEEGQLVACF